MSSHASTLAPSVDQERIRAHLKAFAAIGYSASGGMRRLAFSKADLRARQLLTHFMSNLGLETRIDGVGNVFGRLPTQAESFAPSVLVGSHLDTVPGGGRFDGAIGVVAGLEAAAIVREHVDVSRHTLEIVSFACEESSRFGRGTLGSGIVAGTWEAEDILPLRDAQGQSLSQVLQRVGIDPARLAGARRPPEDFVAFLELHIEQGRVLEEAEACVGIVDTIAAPTRFRLHLTGQADHSGATPMALRKDALAGAAEVILAVERSAKARHGVVATVGTMRVEPGAINVVPGQVELGIDIRSTDSMAKRLAVQQIEHEIEQICADRGLSASLELLTEEEPVSLDPRVIGTLERCARARSIPALSMPSGAGHDAMHMATICPTGMLLVPSRGGISHHSAEWTEFDDIVAGIQVLVDATVAILLEGVAT